MKEGKDSSRWVAAVSCVHRGGKVSLSDPHRRVLGSIVALLEVKMCFRQRGHSRVKVYRYWCSAELE